MTRTRRLRAALLLALLLPFTAHAREATAPPPAQPAGQAPARPALWKVADEDTTIWLFGTIHILPGGIEWYGGPVASALEGADTLITEITEEDAAQAGPTMARLAMAEPPANLRDAMSPDQRQRYEAALTRLQLPVSLFDAHDPWFAAVMLTTLPLIRDGYGTVNGAEALLSQRAKAASLPHLGLETTEYQLGLFDSLPLEVQLRYLDEVVASLPEIGQDVAAMVEAWKKGEAETLAKLMNEDEADAALMQVLLVDRNKAWAQWVQKRLETPGRVFVAVGAGHLAGKDSLQAYLAKRGISVTRVQ